MKWFFGVNEESRNFGEYADMIKVAVATASRRTSLVPHILYDGRENDLTGWLRARGVKVLPVKSRFVPLLEKEAERRRNRDYYTIGAGAFLRVEIVSLKDVVEEGERVVYTDCDVMFEADPVPYLRSCACDIFAVAPECDRNNYAWANTGVMLMDVSALRKGFDDFVRFTSERIPAFVDEAWDQSAYVAYYSGRWNRLPLEMNWKPYWGTNPEAVVVHFHGPKPTRLARHEAGEPYHRPELLTDDYFKYARRWREVLEGA